MSGRCAVVHSPAAVSAPSDAHTGEKLTEFVHKSGVTTVMRLTSSVPHWPIRLGPTLLLGSLLPFAALAQTRRPQPSALQTARRASATDHATGSTPGAPDRPPRCCIRIR